MDYAGEVIKSREIIGYNPATKKFSSDGNSWPGGWRPNPHADETINCPYGITVTRVKE